MYALFRGNFGKPLIFNARGQLRGEYLYESLLVLWIKVWSEESHTDRNGIPVLDSPATSLLFMGFFANMDILLPLILKSIALRHGSSKAILDAGHVDVLKQFVEMLSLLLMGQALVESKSIAPDSKNCSLLKALESADVVVDFLSGMFAVLHPEHMRSMVETFFKTLRACEQLKENKDGLAQAEWTAESIQRVKACRQIRLRACEKLAVLPSFLAINYPLKYSDRLEPVTSRINVGDSTWKMQYNETRQCPNSEFIKVSANTDSRRPQSGWLARRLAEELLSICALSCEAVVAEAIAHIELAQRGTHDRGEESERKRQLQRSDLLDFQSMGIHSITGCYELLLRRHAMDRRFQTDTCRGRIAALYVESIFTQSLQSVRWLARMESSHKVRSIWFLSLIYVLQEAPELLIRARVRSYCNPSVSKFQQDS